LDQDDRLLAQGHGAVDGTRRPQRTLRASPGRRRDDADYNADPIVPGRGSAMFLHEDTGSPTNGCISLPPAQLVRTLEWLQPRARPLIAIQTRSGIRHH